MFTACLYIQAVYRLFTGGLITEFTAPFTPFTAPFTQVYMRLHVLGQGHVITCLHSFTGGLQVFTAPFTGCLHGVNDYHDIHLQPFTGCKHNPQYWRIPPTYMVVSGYLCEVCC